MNTESNTNTYPLSPMQQGMLFHSLSAIDSGVDVEQIFCALHEDVDAAAFEHAWQRVVNRHAILRTTFHWDGLAEPRQEVHPKAAVEFKCADWRGKPAAEQADAFETELEADRQRGFKLAEAPPLRVALFRTGESEYRMLWTFHHLLLDGQALVVVLNEVFACYQALVCGGHLDFSPARPYREHVEWLHQQNLSAAEVFWRQTLKGFFAPTNLGVPQVVHEGFNGRSNRGEQEIEIPEYTTAALKAFARANGFTANTLMQGAWALLLSHYSREDDIVFGAVRACRHSDIPGSRDTVGLFINTVPLRLRVVPEMSLVSWLKSVREAWRALRDHEHSPLVDIQRWSELPPGRPLFETIVNFQDPSWDTALRAQGGCWSTRAFGIRSQSNYPLAVDAYGGAAFRIKMLYHRNRFDDETAARMLGHFKTLLEGMAANPEGTVMEVPMLTENERRQLLVDWNRTEAEFPRNKCAHELFEEQAARNPDGLAVADTRTELSYGELNRRADELACNLHKCGTSEEARIGVCLERSVDMVVAYLAVWKAGAAYVPLDPSYPAERLAFMIEDAKMPVLLTQTALCDRFKSRPAGVTLLCLDSFDGVRGDSGPASRSKNKPANSQVAVTSHDQIPKSKRLAYVIYTSGSTGRPKGVEIEHRSLVNLITWHQRVYQVTPTDRATQIATPAFDAAVWELWPYLAAGASIHIPDEETRLSPERLKTWLADKRITLTFIPTPIAEKMLADPWQDGCVLRALLTGGDRLRRSAGQHLPCLLINHYGPTENTVVTTWTPVPPKEHNAKPPPIGRPIANTQAYILDQNLQPVPIGVAGELHVGGEGLARGYLGKPDLNAEKFIPNRLVDNPGARLYKTGDLVRWLPDGQIEFLCRMDHQAKVRGNRIELGEIELVLNQHPDVREAVAIIRGDETGENRLIACVMPQAGRKVDPGELRKLLKSKLPDYMVPTGFVFPDSFPMTPNGKVDRNALAALPIETGTKFVAPQSSTEDMIAGIWRDVLGIDRVGVRDNFFELGGHSLNATQVISRIRNDFQVELSIRDLFDEPTISALAAKLDAARGTPARSSMPPFVRSGQAGESALSFAQERLWFMEQLEPGISFNNIPIALRIRGDLNINALQFSLNEMVRRHETFRTVFKSQEGRPIAVVDEAGLVAPVVDVSTLPGNQREAEAQRLIAEAARQSFDLAKDMLLRAQLVRSGERAHFLLLTTHHAAFDGWSLGVFYRELAALYAAHAKGEECALPEPPLNYADFARWQRQWLQGAALEEHLTYWRRQLGDAPRSLELPTDRPRGVLQTFRGATTCFSLPEALVTELRRLCQREEVTLFMLLLAALQSLLHRYSGQEDILVGSPVSGRTCMETENLIGFFLNTVVLRGDLSGTPTFRELLKRVRKTALDAFAHQDLPFEKLVDALQPERDLSRSPLYQVLLVLQNEPVHPPKLAGLEVEAIHTHSGTAKFDLMFSLEETRNGLNGFVEYSTDLFDQATIIRILGHFQTLLEAIVANPATKISHLPLLASGERDQMLAEWNDTHMEFARNKCVHELIEEQVGRTPDALAVVFGDEQLTYRELDRRAEVLAAKLRSMSVGPEVPVGLCVERSVEMIIGLLGILKAGGGYVPLDPQYPASRLEFMLEDSRAPMLLTQERLRCKLTFKIPGLTVLSMDALRHALPNAGRSESASPDSLAYVIYTSGSTGRPKGVMVTHRNVVNFFAGMDRVLGTEPGVWLAVTSISFDISVLELFWTLARGFTVVIRPDEKRFQADPHADGNPSNGRSSSIGEQIAKHRVTHMQCTPSLAGALALVPESLAAIQSLEKLLLGGEALSAPLAVKLRAGAQGDLLNMYGPTETTVWSAVQRLDEIGSSIPLGRPIANTAIYILDRNLQPVPVGVPGEIFIGGEGVARGYLKRPELTAERFISNPFGNDDNSRIYRTGDLGRFRADGTIEFLGRLDHQVKIRGHRVELGEIESALAHHPGVREAVVAARDDQPGEKQIVAYMVSKTAIETDELRRFLQGRLPAAMVPARFVFLEKLPLTPNGKINRKALPAPEEERPHLKTAYTAPGTAMEKAIAGVWRDLLRVEKVGLHDNFFDLGGNSLLVVQEQAILSGKLKIDLPVVKLFQHPTIHSLAQSLEEGRPITSGDLNARGRRKQAAYVHQRKREDEVLA